MTPPQKTKLRWWIIWLLSVTAAPLFTVWIQDGRLWMALLVACMVTNLVASFTLMNPEGKANQPSLDGWKITKGFLLFFGGAVLLAAIYFAGFLSVFLRM